jgi:TolA-binding protein
MRAVLTVVPFRWVCTLRRLVLVAALALGEGLPHFALHAASGPEGRSFTNALKSFQGRAWDVADKDFALFVQQHPESPLLSQAVLLQSQARIQARRPAAAIELLAAREAGAGALADEYCFWLGEARLAATNLVAAADTFTRLAKEFPTSPRRAEAAYGEARARAKLDDWPAVVALLAAPEGSFRAFVRTNAAHPATVDGLLLLAEAQVRTRHPQAVAATLALLGQPALAPRAEWQRRYWLARADLDAARPGPALAGASNVLAAAEAAAQPDLLASSRELLADLLSENGRAAEAVAVLEASLATNAPAAIRRSALFKVVRLLLAQGQLAAAAQRLNDFLQGSPDAAATSAALMALAELNLRQYLASLTTTNAPETNRLDQALRLADAALTNAPPDPRVRGHSELLRGWSLWLAGRTNDSRTAFAAAVAALPYSSAQAVARFKLADAALALGDPGAALTNYTLVVEAYAALPAVGSRWREQALYQALRASLVLGDRAAAGRWLEALLAQPAAGADAQGALLLLGESQLAAGAPAEARSLFADFAKRFPDSPKRAAAELGLARAAEREGRWEEARATYSAWLAQWPDDPAQPLAEYALALATAQAGQETNALSRFTNLLARFPEHELAAFAQQWLADFHFRHGDFKAAEEGYQLLFQKWPASELAGEAQMMAGRAAAARLESADAEQYFTAIINASNSPPGLVARALYALGDTTARSESTATNNPLANFSQAINAFRKLQQLYPTNDLAILAEARVGDCYLQLAGADAQYYAAAATAYSNVLAAAASVAARSQAEVGLGLVREKQARLLPATEQAAARQAALEHYLNVAYERALRDGEAADPFWVKRAALEGARLAEELQLWPAAVALYEQLGRLLPALKPGLEPRLQKAREAARQ